MRRDPRQLGETRSRWTLEAIQRVCDWLQGYTLPGVHQILRRLRIHYKRARSHVRSPDPDYLAKLFDIRQAMHRAHAAPERFAALLQDELTYYRQPTLAQAYAPAGPQQALARRSHHANTQRRVVATLDALTGRVVYQQRHRISVPVLVDFYQQVCEVYPHLETIYLIQDNWPVHFHPDVLAALRFQPDKWPRYVPSNWPTEPSPKARYLDLPIQILPLPTYASWANPIEKLWRWLKQDVLHLHPYANRWTELWDEVDAFLDQFADGSSDLLRYVGLTKTSTLYGSVFGGSPVATGLSPPLPD